jgi:hypothetical protein
MQHAVKVSAAITALLCGLTPAFGQAPAPTNACATAAFNDYIRQNLALLQSPGDQPLKSVATTIAQRRLQEQFCLKFAACIVGDPSNTSHDLPFRAAFSSCLRDEAKESE